MLSPRKHRHPRDEPTTHRLRPTFVTAIVVAAAVAGAETPATSEHVAVPPLPAPTPSLLLHGHHQDALTTSAVAVAYDVAYAAAAVMFAGAYENVQYQRIRTRRRHLENHCILPGVGISCFRPSNYTYE